MRHLDMTKGGVLSQGGTFNNNVVAMTAGLVGARDVYTPEACIKLNSLGDSLRLQLNALGRSVGLSFHATGLGGVLNTHWNDLRLTEPSPVEPPTAPVRRLFQLEMIVRGYYVAQRGMINLSLPMTEGDIKAFVGEVRQYLTRNADMLPAGSPDTREFS
jgi:glutamate-1-semialdehyde 2,1-aminomutase